MFRKYRILNHNLPMLTSKIDWDWDFLSSPGPKNFVFSSMAMGISSVCLALSVINLYFKGVIKMLHKLHELQ